MTQLALLMARVALAGIFVFSGIGKLRNPQGFINLLDTAGVPLPFIAGWLGMTVEVIAPILLIIGFRARWIACILMAFTAAASVIGHPFWTHHGNAALMQEIHFLKNIAIIGGLIAIWFHGEKGTLRALLERFR